MAEEDQVQTRAGRQIEAATHDTQVLLGLASNC